MESLEGRVAVVTGASRGIGAAARPLDAQSVRLGLGSRSDAFPGGVATDSALEAGRGRTPESLAGVMTPEDVAEVVVCCRPRPRGHRILPTSFRPASKASWG